MQTISNQYISLSNSVILQDNTLYNNCIIDIENNFISEENSTINFDNCILATGVNSSGQINLLNNKSIIILNIGRVKIKSYII